MNLLRRLFGKPYGSLSAYLKNRTKKAVQYMAHFEALVEHMDGRLENIRRRESTAISGMRRIAAAADIGGDGRAEGDIQIAR